MLFDLRSRRRRTAVRIIYVFLALVMGGGLILVGVGTGNGNGGLLNALGNNGSSTNSSGNSALVQKQLIQAIHETKENPSSPQAWIDLMQARLTQAQNIDGYNATTGAFGSGAKDAGNAGIVAWNEYLKVTNNNPSLTGAQLGKSLYKGVGDYAGMSSAYEYIVKHNATYAGVFACLAYTSYAAGRTQLGDLAAAKAVQLTAKLQRATAQSTFKTARKTPATAKEYALAEC